MIFALEFAGTIMASPLASYEAANRFFELLGRCISAWANVDDELFRIFRDCLGAPYEQSAIIFYRTPGLDVRLNLTSEIVESVLPKTEKRSGSHLHKRVKTWRNLAASFKSLLSTRRRLAHHPVSFRYDAYFSFGGETTFGNAPLYSGQPINPRLELHVGTHESLRNPSAAIPPLTDKDLFEHLSSVRKLANALNEFTRTELTPELEERLRKRREQTPDTN
jgi:hypothetical protein